jgi:hypothetical protein
MPEIVPAVHTAGFVYVVGFGIAEWVLRDFPERDTRTAQLLWQLAAFEGLRLAFVVEPGRAVLGARLFPPDSARGISISNPPSS